MSNDSRPVKRRPRSKEALAGYLGSRGWQTIGAAEWAELRRDLPEIRESVLGRLLGESGLRVEQPYRGIDVHSAVNLELDLKELARVYAARRDLQRVCRDLVIAAKDRARFASLNPRAAAEKRKSKAEMVEWMLVWLDDPAMFATWIQARHAHSVSGSREDLDSNAIS